MRPVLRGVSFEVSEHLGEVSWIFVHSQHPGAVFVDETNTASPEPFAGVTPGVAPRQPRRGVGVDQERLERVADLVAHVRVREIQTSQYNRLQFLLAGYLLNATASISQSISDFLRGGGINSNSHFEVQVA